MFSLLQETDSFRLRRGFDDILLFQFFQFRRNDDLAITGVGIIVVIFLVIIFGLIKFFERRDLFLLDADVVSGGGSLDLILRVQIQEAFQCQLLISAKTSFAHDLSC